MSEDLGLVWLHVVAPPEMETDLTSVSENWGNFGGAGDDEPEAAPKVQGGTRIGRFARGNLNGGRPVRFQEWIDNIEPGRRPSLNFKHTLLPHVPWQYLPSGDRYRRQPNDAIEGLSSQSFEDQGQLDVLFQRHALQTMFADLQLQKLWKKLKAEGMWDDVADRRRGRPRRGVPAGPRRTQAPSPRHGGGDRADPAVHQGARPDGAEGRRRLRRDDRHPADDVRHPEPRPARRDGRQVGLQRRGAEPRRAALPDPQHASTRCASRPTQFEAEQQRGARPQRPPDRARLRRPRAHVPARAASGADREARLSRRPAARRRPRLRRRLRAGRPGERLRADPRGRHA